MFIFTGDAFILIYKHSPPRVPDPRDHLPADLLLVRGACIVDDTMLLSQLTPLLKESIERGRRMLVLTSTERTKPLCYLAVPRSAIKPGRACVYARWWLPCGHSSHRFRHCARPARSHTMLSSTESQCQQPRVFPLHWIPSHFRYRRKLVCMGERG